ncbi:ABC transporter substrate-binding protein [Candidatus Bipolaricaulota bacterium]|nr:ABC transporter substrate-binding protein [Candidatus Bipolaricaulota bacterium]
MQNNMQNKDNSIELHTAPLKWNEFFFTNCPVVSAGNIDVGLGWAAADFRAAGIDYGYLRSRPENDMYPHFIHNLDNMIRHGALYPPVNAHADYRRTRLLGATMLYEGGAMAVRAEDALWRMEDLRGKKIGLSKSLNPIRSDWWRIQEHAGIENMLKINGMTMDDIEIVEFPYEDIDGYYDPDMKPIYDPADQWIEGGKHSDSEKLRSLEDALLNGEVDAVYTQSKNLQHIQEDTGKIKMIEDLSRHPDWTLQVESTPNIITCSDVMAEEHPELVVMYMKNMIKAGRWANKYKQAAAVILDGRTFYRDADDTYEGIKHVDMVPNLSPKNLACIKIGKDFMLSHGYIKNDFDVNEWAAPEFLEQAMKELIEEEWKIEKEAKFPQPGL